MDFQELIDRLREQGQSWEAYEDIGLSHALEDAVEAIEKLLAEREALNSEIKGRCSFCAHKGKCLFDQDSMIDCAYFGMKDWKWRGAATPDRHPEN